MPDTNAAAAEEHVDRSYADWAARRRTVPAFLARRTRTFLLLSQASLGSAALAVCFVSASGLVLLALVVHAR